MSILGYAPAEKAAWPTGHLTARVEDLDERHGVFPNHVATPLLGTLMHLEPSDIQEFIIQLKSHALARTGHGGNPPRFNVLTRNIDAEVSAGLDPRIGTLLQDGPQSFNPRDELWVTVGYWSISALMSHLVEGRTSWFKRDISTFSKRFLMKVRSEARSIPRLASFFSKVPKRKTAKSGMYFRLCTLPWADDQGISPSDVENLIRRTVQRFRRTHAKDKADVRDADWVVIAMRSMVPLPHNEIYQNYREQTNPIGLYQSVFMEADDPTVLLEEQRRSPEVYWRFVGKIIAHKLTSGGVHLQGVTTK
jgi:hypothetical protein